MLSEHHCIWIIGVTHDIFSIVDHFTVFVTTKMISVLELTCQKDNKLYAQLISFEKAQIDGVLPRGFVVVILTNYFWREPSFTFTFTSISSCV